MRNATAAKTLIIVGLLLVFIAVFADPLGLGRHPGFGWRQWLVSIVGVVVLLTGLYLRRSVR